MEEELYFELLDEEFYIIEKFFNQNKFHIPALSVINKRFPGKIFVNNKNNPTIVLVWAISRWSYLYYSENENNISNFIYEIIDKKIKYILNKLKITNFEIYIENKEKCINYLENKINDIIINKHYENTYELSLDNFKKYFDSIILPNNIVVQKNEISLAPKEYKLFLSDNFLKIKTESVSLIKDEKEISRASNNGMEYNKNYFIDLDTFDKLQRNKGYGSITAAILIDMLLKKDILPLWETTEDNISSIKIAKKLGFQKIEKYIVYIIRII